jgi:hypothetical protein
MVKKDKNGKYQRTFTTDSKGNKVYDKISFKYGTVEDSQSQYSDKAKTTFDCFIIGSPSIVAWT